MDRRVAHERALLVAHQEYDADDAEHRGEKEQTHFSSDSHEAPGSGMLFLHGVLLEKVSVRRSSRADLDSLRGLELHERSTRATRLVSREKSRRAGPPGGIEPAEKIFDQNELRTLQQYPDIAREFLLVCAHPFGQLGEQAVRVGAEFFEQGIDLPCGAAQALGGVESERQYDVLPGVEVAEQSTARREKRDSRPERGALRGVQAVDLQAEQHEPRAGFRFEVEHRAEQARFPVVAQARHPMASARRNPDAVFPTVRGRLVAERHLRVNRSTRSRIGAGRRVGVGHTLAVTRPKNAWPNTR